MDQQDACHLLGALFDEPVLEGSAQPLHAALRLGFHGSMSPELQDGAASYITAIALRATRTWSSRLYLDTSLLNSKEESHAA